MSFRRPLRSLISAALIFLARGATSCIACLNDTSVSAAENEFRSRYETSSGKDAPTSLDQPRAGEVNLWGVAGLAIGSGIAAGSFAQRRRQKRKDL